MLFLAPFSRSFLLAAGKYSARWLEMSSLGGRWPKKLYILRPRLAKKDPDEGDLGRGACGAATGLEALSDTGTPKADMTLIVLARCV
jgi:hypothetical protein